MGTHSPEGGDKPSNHGLSGFKLLPEKRGAGPQVQKPEIPVTDNSSAKLEELPKRPLKRRHRGAF